MTAEGYNFLLLYPEALPIESNLDDVTKKRLYHVLNLAKIVLESKSFLYDSDHLEAAIKLLNPETKKSCANNSHIGTIKDWEIQDYDNFFGITRVESPDPIECSIFSLLSACQTFLSMVQSRSFADLNVIDCQISGFKSHIELMIRVLEIPLEDTHE
jgi:hypothetical protein